MLDLASLLFIVKMEAHHSGFWKSLQTQSKISFFSSDFLWVLCGWRLITTRLFRFWELYANWIEDRSFTAFIGDFVCFTVRNLSRFSLFDEILSIEYSSVDARTMLCRMIPRKKKTVIVPVYLNVYDLTPINGYAYWVGLCVLSLWCSRFVFFSFSSYLSIISTNSQNFR